MKQRITLIRLNQLNASFIIKDRGSIQSIKITRLLATSPHGSGFWDDLHLRIIDQKGLSLFDHPLAAYTGNMPDVDEISLNEYFAVMGHLTVNVYSKKGNAFDIELAYELNDDPDA